MSVGGVSNYETLPRSYTVSHILLSISLLTTVDEHLRIRSRLHRSEGLPCCYSGDSNGGRIFQTHAFGHGNNSLTTFCDHVLSRGSKIRWIAATEHCKICWSEWANVLVVFH